MPRSHPAYGSSTAVVISPRKGLGKIIGEKVFPVKFTLIAQKSKSMSAVPIRERFERKIGYNSATGESVLLFAW